MRREGSTKIPPELSLSKSGMTPLPRFITGKSPWFIFTFVALSIGLPLVILSLFSVIWSYSNAERTSLTADLAIAQTGADSISRRVAAVQSELNIHASLLASDIASGRDPQAAAMEHSHHVVEGHSEVSSLYFYGADGTLIFNSGEGTLEGIPAPDTLLGQALTGGDSDQAPLVVTTVPVNNVDQASYGTFVAEINITAIQSTLDNLEFQGERDLSVLTGSGSVVTSINVSEVDSSDSLPAEVTALIDQDSSGSGTFRFDNGVDNLVAFTRIPGSDWVVVSAQPLSNALTGPYSLASRVAAIAGVLLLVAIAIAGLITFVYKRNQELYSELTTSLTRERGIAETLQDSLVSRIDEHHLLTVGVRHSSATKGAFVGGDFFDLIPMSPTKVAVMIGDVGGKGIATAVQTAVVRGLIRGLIHEGETPEDLMLTLNERILALSGIFVSPETFVTLVFGIYDSLDGTYTYCQAGHPSPMVSSKGRGAVELPQISGVPLGVIEDPEYQTKIVHLRSEDTLMMFTDGLIETRHNGELFGEERTRRIFSHNAHFTPQNLAERVYRECVRFAKGKLSDDLAVLVFRRSPDLPAPIMTGSTSLIDGTDSPLNLGERAATGPFSLRNDTV